MRSILLAIVAIALATSAVHAAPFDGDWRGAVSTPDGTEYRIRIVIKDGGATQYFRDEKGNAWSADSRKKVICTNLNDICVVAWLNQDGIWTEHQMFSMSLINASKVKVLWMRHVTNREQGKDGVPWSQRGEGELILVD